MKKETILCLFLVAICSILIVERAECKARHRNRFRNNTRASHRAEPGDKGSQLAWYLGAESPLDCGTRPAFEKRYPTLSNNYDTRKAQKRISHGNAFHFGEYPSFAVIRHKEDGGFVCGAVLIGKRSALTASHCLEGVPPTRMVLLLGGNPGYEDDSAAVQHFNILDACHHPKACLHEEHLVPFDMAYLMLDGDVTYTDTIRPVCLPFGLHDHFQPNDDDYFDGIGAGKYSDLPNHKFPGGPNFKMELSPKWCPRKERERYPEIDTTIKCYSSLKSNYCKGDSGSPVYYYRKHENGYRQYLAGIVSSLTYPECRINQDQNFGIANVPEFVDPWYYVMIEQKICFNINKFEGDLYKCDYKDITEFPRQ